MTADLDVAELAPLLGPWGITQAGKPLEIEPISGGLSGAIIWRVSHEGHEYCLRRWPVKHPSAEQLRTIHQLLEHVRHTEFESVPVLHTTLRGDTFVSSGGHLWELTCWMAGQPLCNHSSNEQQRVAAIETLAKFHLAAATFGLANRNTLSEPAPGLLRRQAILAELASGGLAELSQAVRDEPSSPTRETLVQVLSRIEHALPGALATVEACAKIALPLQWCLRDVHPGNVLLQDNLVTGFVDFGAVAIDSVAGDIARLVGGLQCNPAARQDYLRAYARIRPLTNDEQHAVSAFHVGGLISSAANWIRWLCVERSVPLTNIAQARVKELLSQFALVDSWNKGKFWGILN